MKKLQALWVAAALAGAITVSAPVVAGSNVAVEGTRFTMEVPRGWNPGYKDMDKLFMIYFKDPNSGAALEGVFLRGAQDGKFSLADFKKARIAGENKRYDGKGHKVVKDGDIKIDGAKGVYLHTAWKDGTKSMEKHTALHLKNGLRYLVVMSGEKGKVNKAVFDHAVATFAPVKGK